VDTVADPPVTSRGWLRRVRLDLTLEAHGPHVARAAVADCLRALGVEEGCVEFALLGTSELVTNALVHGALPCTMVLFTRGGFFRVEVLDASPVRPSVPPSTGLLESGRGLVMVAALSTRWGSERRAAGKAVWFEGLATPR
jgi:serine/threonine-protein kinase RsbW